jgi:hypothetical protein
MIRQSHDKAYALARLALEAETLLKLVIKERKLR